MALPARFDDLFNLVHDPATLVVAWRRVRGNKGKRSGGVDGIAPVDVADAAELLADLREDVKAGVFVPLPARERMIPKSGGKLRRLGDRDRRDRVAQAALKLVLEPILSAQDQLVAGVSAGQHVNDASATRVSLSMVSVRGCCRPEVREHAALVVA